MKKLYFTLYLVCISLITNAQEPFSKLYEYFLGIYGGMTVSKVIQARNGDFIVSGVVSVGNVGMTNYVILVTDASGNLKWLKEIDTPDYWSPSYESDVIQTQDNGFLFCGNDPYGRGGVLVKYDPDWNISWNKTYQTELSLS